MGAGSTSAYHYFPVPTMILFMEGGGGAANGKSDRSAPLKHETQWLAST